MPHSYSSLGQLVTTARQRHSWASGCPTDGIVSRDRAAADQSPSHPLSIGRTPGMRCGTTWSIGLRILPSDRLDATSDHGEGFGDGTVPSPRTPSRIVGRLNAQRTTGCSRRHSAWRRPRAIGEDHSNIEPTLEQRCQAFRWWATGCPTQRERVLWASGCPTFSMNVGHSRPLRSHAFDRDAEGNAVFIGHPPCVIRDRPAGRARMRRRWVKVEARPELALGGEAHLPHTPLLTQNLAERTGLRLFCTVGQPAAQQCSRLCGQPAAQHIQASVSMPSIIGVADDAVALFR